MTATRPGAPRQQAADTKEFLTMRTFVLLFSALLTSVVLVGAGADPVRKSTKTDPSAEAPASVQVQKSPVRTPADQPEKTSPTLARPGEELPEVAVSPSDAAAAFQINWSSINSGGAISASSANYKMGLSVGQSVAGAGASANYKAGIGFWYGAGAGGIIVECPITLSGDVNLTGTLTSADIIYLVNFVFKGGPTPNPCEASGDVGCNGTVTSADIIYLVNHVFKGGPPPCDICTQIPGLWTCP
jgi:hypothetical protein